MTDFNKGDLIRITDPDTAASKTIWLAEDEDGTLFTYDGLDPFAPQVPLSELLAEGSYAIELEKAFEDALPTVPGEYEDRLREQDKQFLLELDPEFELDANSKLPWVLGEDGRWTAPNGEVRPVEDNWLLVVHGFDFFPWDERAVR